MVFDSIPPEHHDKFDSYFEEMSSSIQAGKLSYMEIHKVMDNYNRYISQRERKSIHIKSFLTLRRDRHECQH
jgi:hypothetical protein